MSALKKNLMVGITVLLALILLGWMLLRFSDAPFRLFAKAQMPMIINDAIAATVSSERAAVKIDPAPEGQAQIVFYRKRPFFGNKEIFALSEGGNEFAQLRFGQYAVHVIEPGTRQFALAAGGEALELQAQAGQTYYVEGELVKAEGGKRQSLKRVDEDQFRKVSFQLMKLETKAAE